MSRQTRSQSAVSRRAKAIIVDPRLLVGVLLVVGSMGGVLAIVSAADESIDVYVAGEALAPGERVDAHDLVLRSVRLDSAAGHYLSSSDLPDEGVLVTHPIAEGELVPRSAVGESSGTRLTAVVVSTEGRLPDSVDVGSTVDVWASRSEEGGGFGAPSVVVPGATVVRLVETETIVAGGEISAVELLVPRTRVAHLLEALANDAAISVVPTSIPLVG